MELNLSGNLFCKNSSGIIFLSTYLSCLPFEKESASNDFLIISKKYIK